MQRGVFILSLDFELVWGSRDLVRRDPEPLLAAARRTRDQVFEPLLALLVDRGMAATWATVGHLFLDRGASLADLTPPRHGWVQGGWFDGVPKGSEEEHPEFFGRALVRRLVERGQEVGSHSFSHPIFGDPGCSVEAADSDLARCVREAQTLGIELRSFVFPRNSAGHHHLLARHGFTCWRGLEPTWYNRRGPGPLRRLGHLADVVAARRPPTVLPTRDEHGLWVIPASASFLPVDGVRRAIPIERRVTRAVRGLDQASLDRRICHLWSHPINLATDPPATLDMFRRVLDHAARLRDRGALDVLTMGQVAELMNQAA